MEIKENSKEEFLEKLYQFMENRGTPIPSKLPNLGGRELELWTLFCCVIKRGGYDEVVAKKLWKNIITEYRVPSTCTAASFSLKNHYAKYLFPYEQVFYFEQPDRYYPTDTPSSPTPSVSPTPSPSLSPSLSPATASPPSLSRPTIGAKRPFSATTSPAPSYSPLPPSDDHDMGSNPHTPSSASQTSYPSFNPAATVAASRHSSALFPPTGTATIPTRPLSKRRRIGDVLIQRRIECSLACGRSEHVEWALQKVLSLTGASETVTGSLLSLMPALQPSLVSLLRDFLDPGWRQRSPNGQKEDNTLNVNNNNNNNNNNHQQYQNNYNEDNYQGTTNKTIENDDIKTPNTEYRDSFLMETEEFKSDEEETKEKQEKYDTYQDEKEHQKESEDEENEEDIDVEEDEDEDEDENTIVSGLFDGSISEQHSHILNVVHVNRREIERRAFISLIILRNLSIIEKNQRILGQDRILPQLWIQLLDSTKFHVEWRIRALECLTNTAQFTPLAAHLGVHHHHHHHHHSSEKKEQLSSTPKSDQEQQTRRKDIEPQPWLCRVLLDELQHGICQRSVLSLRRLALEYLDDIIHEEQLESVIGKRLWSRTVGVLIDWMAVLVPSPDSDSDEETESEDEDEDDEEGNEIRRQRRIRIKEQRRAEVEKEEAEEMCGTAALHILHRLAMFSSHRVQKTLALHHAGVTRIMDMVRIQAAEPMAARIRQSQGSGYYATAETGTLVDQDPGGGSSSMLAPSSPMMMMDHQLHRQCVEILARLVRIPQAASMLRSYHEEIALLASLSSEEMSHLFSFILYEVSMAE